MSILMTPGQQPPRKTLISRALQAGDTLNAGPALTSFLERRPEDGLAQTEEHLKEMYAYVRYCY